MWALLPCCVLWAAPITPNTATQVPGWAATTTGKCGGERARGAALRQWGRGHRHSSGGHVSFERLQVIRLRVCSYCGYLCTALYCWLAPFAQNVTLPILVCDEDTVRGGYLGTWEAMLCRPSCTYAKKSVPCCPACQIEALPVSWQQRASAGLEWD